MDEENKDYDNILKNIKKLNPLLGLKPEVSGLWHNLAICVARQCTF